MGFLSRIRDAIYPGEFGTPGKKNHQGFKPAKGLSKKRRKLRRMQRAARRINRK